MILAQQEHLDSFGKDFETLQVQPPPEALDAFIELQTNWAEDYDRVLTALVEIQKPDPDQSLISDGIAMLEEHLASDEKTVQEHKDFAKEVGKLESDFPILAYLETRNREKHFVMDILRSYLFEEENNK